MKFVFDAGVIVYAGSGVHRKYLFLKNASGWLDTPKGHMEKGEHAEEAALRETWEETGIKARPDPFFRDSVEYWYAENGERTKKQVTFFIAEVASDTKIKISDEHISYQWLDYGSSMKMLSFKDQKELIARVDAH